MPGKNPSKMELTGMPAAIGIGAGVSVLMTVICSAALAFLISSGRMAPGSMGYGVLGILMLSAVIGSAMACAKVQGKRMIVSAASAASYLTVLLCMTALFFGGEYNGVLVTTLVILGGGIINGLLPTGKGRTKIRHSKRRYG